MDENYHLMNCEICAFLGSADNEDVDENYHLMNCEICAFLGSADGL